MAAGIFLSWSMPDEPAVTELKRLLQGLGFPLWEYRDGIKAGDDIHAEWSRQGNQVVFASGGRIGMIDVPA